MPKIMVVSGTQDAKNIISNLIKSDNEVIATVTTDYGKELLEGHSGIKVYKGKLNAEEMLNFIKDKGIQFVVDASHPFAREASINAIDACTRCGVPYLRFERKSTLNEGDFVINVKNFEEAAQAAADFEGNIFLTIGSNNIRYFTEKIADFKNRLFARILPDSKMLLKCEELGLTAENIIAVKGPFSADMNLEMLKHCKAAVMVTKESGGTGGTDEKLEAASKFGIPVIMVTRPQIDYGRKVSTVEEVVQFIESQAVHIRGL